MVIEAIKVAMFIEYFYPLVGGAEQQLEQLAKKLKERDVEVKIFTLHRKGLKKKELLGGIPVFRKYAILRFIKLPFGKLIRKGLDIPAYRFEDTYADIDQVYWDEAMAHQGFHLKTIGLYLYRFYLFGVQALKWLILNVLMFFTFLMERKNMDIVHCHLMVSPFTSAACRMGRLFGKKVLMKLGDVYDLNVLEKYSLSQWHLRNFKRSVDLFICINQEIKKMLLRKGVQPGQIKIITNGVDTARFQPIEEDKKDALKRELSLSGKKLITFVGALKRKKGLDILLQSWRGLLGMSHNLLLILVGRADNHAEYLQRLVKELNLSESVRFVGEVSDVSRYLGASDIFVLPSRSEGMANALLEAMSCGLPIVATAVGGAKDAIENKKSGILVEPGNQEELREGIRQLIEDIQYAKTLGESARKRANDIYSFQKVTEDYLSLYQELVESQKRDY